jgi:sensor c-di-GMP phosphodiesterase-like protein
MSSTVVKEASLLRDLGYHVSIDDFGTGYSNLKLLGEVQPDVLKIDKSFVFDMEDNSLRSNLIPQMVSFARAVGAMVVAEGVENEKQERQLKDLGIEFAQGYFYSRPVPIEDFLKYLSENSA